MTKGLDKNCPIVINYIPMAARTKKAQQIGHFGRLVRGHRERLGFTMNELARKIEMDQGLLSKIERGKRPPPQIVPHVQRIAEALGLEVGSAELIELVEVAYRERFGKKGKWSEIVSVSFGKEKELVLTRTPVVSRGLAGYAPPETREIIPPDSPIGQYFKLRSDAEILEGLGAPPDQSELAKMFLQSYLERCGLSGWHITHVEQVGEIFNVECRLPDGKQYEITISPKREHRGFRRDGSVTE